MEKGKKYKITLLDADFPEEITPFNVRVLDKDGKEDVLVVEEYTDTEEHKEMLDKINFETINSSEFWEENNEFMDYNDVYFIVYYKRHGIYETCSGYPLRFKEIKS